MGFRYVRDPLFLAAAATLLVAHLLLPESATAWRAHGNDVLLVPFCVPPMLGLMRRVGLRHHDAPPMAQEVLAAIVVVAVVFEILLPATGLPGANPVADYRDVVAYLGGGFVSMVAWHTYCRRVNEAA